jgi:hypothetical protein
MRIKYPFLGIIFFNLISVLDIFFHDAVELLKNVPFLWRIPALVLPNSQILFALLSNEI